MRGLKASLAVLAAVLLCLGLPASASASTPVATVAGGGVSAAGDWQYDPSGSKWREYMINITGKLLGDSMPNAWKAEQLANQFRMGKGVPSGEALNTQFGYANYSRDANGKLVEIPAQGQGSYDDYVLQEKEKIRTGTSTRKGVNAPATKGGQFVKAGLGAAGALTFFPIGTMLGSSGTNVVGGWFGFNAQDAVCSMTSEGGLWNNVLEWASGQDCDMWAQDRASINLDALGAYGPSVWGDYWIQFVAAYTMEDLPDWYYACYAYVGPMGSVRPTYSTGLEDENWYFATGDGLTVSPQKWTAASAFHNTNCSELGGAVSGVNYIVASGLPETVRDVDYQIGFHHGMPPALLGTMSVPVDVSEPGGAGDPPRQMVCTVEYSDGTKLSVEGAIYRESEGVIEPPACPATPAGKVPEKVSVDQKTVGGTGGASGSGGLAAGTNVVASGMGAPGSQNVYEEQTTDAYKDWVEQFPECGTGACKLDLLVKSPSGDNYASCFDLADGCVDWFTDPAKSSTYTCRYGVQEVDLSECNLYANLFQPGRIAVGAPYSDPMTGTWSGGSNAPRPDQQAMGQGIRAPETHRGCDGMNITGFDPVGFVMRPVQCALEWAFVPRGLVVEASFAGAGEAWDGKPPAVIAAAVDGFALAPSASGCSRSVTLFGTTFSIIDACSGPMQQVAHISTLVTSAGMVILVIVVLKRQIAGMVGYNQGQG